MEQLLLYIVTISGFSGLMLGLYSFLVPVLQRRGINLPFIGRGPDEEGYEYEFEDEDAEQFGAAAFGPRRASLLQRVPRRASKGPEPEEDYEDEEDDYLDEEGDELLGDLDLSRERAEVAAEEADDEELAELTFEAEVDPVLDAFAEDVEEDELDEDDEQEEDEDAEDGEEDDEDEDYEDEDEEEEQQPAPAVVQVVPAGATDNNDMLALFDEADDAGKEIEAWREDLPDVSIADVLADAREISAMLRGRRSA